MSVFLSGGKSGGDLQRRCQQAVFTSGSGTKKPAASGRFFGTASSADQ